MYKKSSRNPTYVTWRCLIGRCTNEKFDNYKQYGGSGITLDPKWLDFENFVNDMGSRPENKTLDRIDNSKGYFKENCRWSTKKEQQSNRKSVLWITYNGVTKTSKDWAIELGYSKSTIWNRIKLYGWSIEKTLTTKRLGA
jgi:hypothetical protein